MRQWFNRMTMLVVALVLAAGIQVYPAKAAPASESVSILTLHETDDFRLSSMNNYFLAPYTLTHESGTDYVSFTIKDSTTVTSFKTEQGGVLTESDIVSADTAANTRVVKFPVADLNGVLKVRVHISTMAGNRPYEMDHDVRLIFNRAIDHSAIETLVASAEAKLKAAVVGNLEGQYPESAKTALTAAIAAAKTKGSYLSAQALINEAATELTAAIAAFDAAKHGAASGSVTVLTLHETDDFRLSSMNKYFLAPYTLTRESGTDYVSFTIKDSTTVTSFKTEQGGVLTESDIVSTDDAANTRVVKFPVADLNGVLKVRVHISTMAGDRPYEMDHDVRLIFNRAIDHAAIETLVASAEAKLKAAVVGTEDGQYPESAKTVLTAAVAAAKTKGSYLSTQALINEAATELTAAIAAFDAAKHGAANESVTMLTLHATDDFKLSSMNNYFLTPYTLTHESGKDYVSFKIKDSATVTSFKTEQGGVLTESDVVSTDTAADTRIVKFPVTDLNGVLKARVHISTMAGDRPYEMDHDVRLIFNRAIDHAAIETLVASAEAKLKAAVVGTEDGQYPESAKTALTAAVAAAKTKGSYLSTQALINEAATELTAAIATFDAAVVKSNGSAGPGAPTNPNGIADGKYSIDFTILKQGTSEASVMNGYTVHPATLTVSGGTSKITLRLTQSNEITGFKVNGSAPSTVSSNPSKNTRDVEFSVSDLTGVLNGWVQINWAEFNYHEEYNVQIKFGNHYAYTEPGFEGNPSIPSTPPAEEEKDPNAPATGEETENGNTEEAGGGQPTTPSTIAFNDVSNHWASQSIKRAVGLGIVNGYSDGSFKPNGVVTRAEFTAMISRALKLQSQNEPVSFTDLSSVPAWAKPFIEQAAAAGIINGYADQTFRPFKQITRSEITVIVVKALGLPLESASPLQFADTANIPEYAKAYIATAVKYGLIEGKTNNRFDPLANATRAEALTLVLRALDNAEAQAQSNK